MGDPILFQIEDRGYGRGISKVIGPAGLEIACGQEADELSVAMARAVHEEWKELMTLVDPPTPPEPGETGGLRAKDLRNRVVVLHATGEGSDPETLDKNGKPWEWTDCDVWVIDRAGIELHEKGLRVSWWRVREQLTAAEGNYVAGRVSEQEDRSIILTTLTGAARDVVEKVMPEILSGAETNTPASDDEPF